MAIERLFTTGSLRPEDMVRTKIAFSSDETQEAHLSVPENWSIEAANSFREALCHKVPTTIRTIEENTVPSWLWKHRPSTETLSHAETSVTDVFTRIAGAATYRGWKAGLWEDEIEASIFYDEARAVLLTRRMGFAPEAMANMGLDWAYGMPVTLNAPKTKQSKNTLVLQNESIDNILSQEEPRTRNKWNNFCEQSRHKQKSSIVFKDTLTEWSTLPSPANAPRVQINLIAFRHADGTVDTVGLQQTTRLAVLLVELHEDIWAWENERPLAISFSNFAGLLMSLAMPYDSNQGRTTAAALAAIISGTAATTSALLAEKLGSSSRFSVKRETILRSLRNRLRASFGEATDYEKLSVIPQTITLESGADLVLISAARHACELAVKSVESKGLRHLQVTSLFTDYNFAPLLDATSQGTEAENSLVSDYAQNNGTFACRSNPTIAQGMSLLGYDQADCDSVEEYLVGARTLVGAPGVNQTFLKEKGFDQATLNRIEKNLQQVSHLRQAFTPWALGFEFCQNVLSIPAEKLKDLSFDVLRHLDFSSREINAASDFCCGHKNIRGALELNNDDHDIFITCEDLSPESQIRMAAAVQPFIDGETNLTLSIPSAVVAQVRGELILMSWKMGVKNMVLTLDGLPPSQTAAHPVAQIMKRQTESVRMQKPAIGNVMQNVLPKKKSRLSGKKSTILSTKLSSKKYLTGNQ